MTSFILKVLCIREFALENLNSLKKITFPKKVSSSKYNLRDLYLFLSKKYTCSHQSFILF